jgi:hypothetical protein
MFCDRGEMCEHFQRPVNAMLGSVLRQNAITTKDRVAAAAVTHARSPEKTSGAWEIQI